ncbi:MAG: DUF333 domain-containing protein [Halopseudomonas sp.]|uniref:putative hemolysin n=1 Tax=Halopseudomonas sp. TaxID=2901191 RepID=UPI003001F5B5
MKITTLLVAGLALLALAACSSKESKPSVPAMGLPNPAATFCVQQGGEYNTQTGICRLADGSEMDGWEYYRANQ